MGTREAGVDVKQGRLPFWAAALSWVMLLLAVFFVTAGTLPITHPYLLRMLPWILARATGLTAFLVLTVVVGIGILMSHPKNLIEWRFSKILVVWHRYLTILLFALVVAHVGAIVLDAYAKVGIVGALVPGLSVYRALPVAFGTIGLYGLVILTMTAALPKLLPNAGWLKVHRVAIFAFVVLWLHGVLAGSDTRGMMDLYVACGIVILLSYTGRWWVERPTAKRPEGSLPPGDTKPSPSTNN